ncbi:coiled-coil domain-containing protein 150 isoform X2 [Pseudophryne corroboree]|uniref:coiled-coil domain-containing protein 150 isoform X2 n=1 Tax=Pseudophryne corroboree TaxID=495146 RepID=UPI0030819EBB
MARPVLQPLRIHPTVPETFTVLEQRLRMAEEQAETLIIDLEALGVTCHSTKLEYQKSAEGLPPISPVRARPAFTGESILWSNCENLVSRTCHIESMLQTLKAAVLQLQTRQELDTKHCGELEQHMHEMQEKHAKELKKAQLEIMRLRQYFNSTTKAREKEEETKERLSAALEFESMTKLQEKLSEENSLRTLLEEERDVLLLTLQDLTKAIEKERKHIQELQLHCQTVYREGQEVRDKLQEVEPRCQKLEIKNEELQSDLEAKDSLVSQLQEEVKLQEKLSQDADLRAVLEKERDVLLLMLQDLTKAIEKERKHVQELQLHCQTVYREGQEVRDKLQEVEPRCQKLEMKNKQLQSDLEAKDLHVSQLQDEIKIIQQKCEAEQAELAEVRGDSVALREAAEKVQALNKQLEDQCSELTVNMQKLNNDNIRLMTDHQQELKVVKDTMAQKLQVKEHLLSAVQASLTGKLQGLQSHRTQLESELAQSQKQVQKLEAELSGYQMKLQTAESQQLAKINLLQRSMEVAHQDNQKLACALEKALQINTALQNDMGELAKEVQNKVAEEKQLLMIRAQAEEDIRIKAQLSEEHLASLTKHQLQCSEAKKAAQKEVAELKKALACASVKSAAISRANRELRSRESLLEKETLHQKDLICGFKTQLRSCIQNKETKKQAERTQALEVELERMQKMKDEYEKSNNEQCKRIERFMSEVSSLRKEIAAAASQRENTLQNQLEKEMKFRQELEERYMDLENRVKTFQYEKTVTDRKLREASVESEEISLTLQEAQSWCHSAEPQLELLKNRRGKEDVPECCHVKHPQFLTHSTMEHWATKQKLKLISRNFQLNEKRKPPGDQAPHTAS